MTQKRNIVTVVIGAVLLGLFVWYVQGPKAEYGYAAVAFKKTGDIVQAYTPKNDVANFKGLGGRTVLPEDYGMLWQYTTPQKPSFTMRGMRFPLDFIWLRDGKVVEITAGVQLGAENIVPKVDVTGVLEVNAGYAFRHAVKVGDEAEIMGSAWSGQ